MMPSEITKEHADLLLKELAKAYRKTCGKNSDIEVVIVGGGSILLNYGFRTMTTDFDTISTSETALKDASIMVRDKFNLDNDWINSDFMRTTSYSDKIRQYSSFYRAYNNGHFVVRTIKAEYLIRRQLRALTAEPLPGDRRKNTYVRYMSEVRQQIS